MGLHEADLKARLVRYLDRRHKMPRRLEGKGGAMEDEMRALVAALARVAPRSCRQACGLVASFRGCLGWEIATGGLWPTEREIRTRQDGWVHRASGCGRARAKVGTPDHRRPHGAG